MVSDNKDNTEDNKGNKDELDPIPPGNYTVQFKKDCITYFLGIIVNGPYKGREVKVPKGYRSVELQYATHDTHTTLQ